LPASPGTAELPVVNFAESSVLAFNFGIFGSEGKIVDFSCAVKRSAY